MWNVLAVIGATPQYAAFAMPELRALLAKAGVSDYRLKRNMEQHKDFPYVEFEMEKLWSNECMDVPNRRLQQLQRVFSSAVLIHKLVLLVGSASNYDELLSSWNLENVQSILGQETVSCKFQFSSRETHLAKLQQVGLINEVIKRSGFRGSIKLSQPDHAFSLIESHYQQEGGTLKGLKHIYFGLDIATNRLQGKKISTQYCLSERAYLGPTSTDSDLAFLMCHQAQINEGSMVIDPFVGTGSLLVPPAHYGAFTFGSDIDMRVLHGSKVGRLNSKAKLTESQQNSSNPRISLNFEQYGLRTPEIIRMDCLRTRLRATGLFDAVICDPPYGLRAMSRRASSKHKEAGNPQWQNYRKLEKADREQIFQGLFNFSSQSLRSGGKLVCLYPVFAADIADDSLIDNQLPQHPQFKLLESSPNPMAMGNARVLMTLQRL